MFSFNKLNQIIGSVGKVPIIAELMPSRWSYEALMVKQFRDNKFEKQFFELEKTRSFADFKNALYVKELHSACERASNCVDSIAEEDPEYDTVSIRRVEEYNLALLREEIAAEMYRLPEFRCKNVDKLTVESFDEDVAEDVYNYLDAVGSYYSKMFNDADREWDSRKQYFNSQRPGYVNSRRDKYHNEKLLDIVTNKYEVLNKNKIIRYKNRLIQQVDPIFLDADNSTYFGFRSHFYAPRKWFCGRYYDTYSFDIVIIWLFSLLCYITLYFDVLKKAIDWVGNIHYAALHKKENKAAAPVAETEAAPKSEESSETEEKRPKLKVVSDEKDDN
jgi:hypothetical protein